MSTFTDLEKDATSVDGFVNDNALIVTRRNGPKPSWQYIVDQVYAQLGYAVAGSFVDGFTYTNIRQVGVDASGNTWIYAGGQQNIPHVVEAGTVPSEPEYFQVSVNSADNVVLDNGENLQQAIDRLNLEIDEQSFASGIDADNGGSVQDFIDASGVDGLKSVESLLLTSSTGKIKTKSFYSSKNYGGTSYLYTSESASKHMTIKGSTAYFAINAIAAWSGDQSDLNVLFDWVDDGSTGCLSFDVSDLDLTHFGAIKDDITKDNSVAAQASADLLGYVVLPISKIPIYLSTPIDVTGKFEFNITSRNKLSNVFNSAKSYSDQDYLSKIYAPNGLLHNVYNASTNQARCREYVDSVMIYGDRRSGSVALKGRAANNITNSLIINFEKIIENDFAYLSYIRNSRFDRADYFAHIATANGFYINDCWFGSGIQKGVEMEGLTLGVNAISTGYPVVYSGCNINCGSNTEFIARSRGVFNFNNNYIETFSDMTLGDSYFLHRAGRFDNGAWVMGDGNEINAQNHTDYLVKFYGDNAAGTQNFKGQINKSQRIIGLSSATPVVVGFVSADFPSASTEVFEVTSDYSIGVDRSGNFNNYNGRISCADSTETDFSGTSFVDLPVTAVSPTGTDAIAGNILTKRSSGDYRCKAEVQVKTAATLRSAEIGIFVNGAKVSGVITSIVVDAAVTGDYYETVIVEANPVPLGRGDDVQVRGRNGGSATVTKFWMDKI